MEHVLPGYPRAMGAQRFVIFDHAGPSSYQTGGESIQAALLGVPAIDWVDMPTPPVSVSRNYSVALLYPAGRTGLAAYAVQALWYDLANGLEVTAGTDLSAEVIRLHAIGGLG